METEEKNIKVLIIGAKGNLGQDLAKIFSVDSKYSVFGWDKDELDITNKRQVEEKITELAPDLIVNTAAYNAVDKCEELAEFETAKKINGYAVGFLAQTAKKIGATLVHYGTQFAFNGENKEGYKEDDQINPLNRYAESKCLGEKQLQENVDRFYLIRTSRLFGRPGSSKTSKPSFIDIMLRLAKEKENLEVVDEEVDCFTYTPDLAKATKSLVEDDMPFGIYHITNIGAYTWYGAARKIFEEAGISIKMTPVSADKFPRLAKRPKYSILLNTKLPPLRSFEDALKEYLSQK
jgi:dTDP-4-dehydrorhamnose reductase